MTAPDNVKFQIIDDIKNDLAQDYEIIDVDGARAVFEQGWGLVRASNTQPAITMRFEAYDRAQVAEYMRRFRKLLDKHPEVDAQKLDDQIAAFSSQNGGTLA